MTRLQLHGLLALSAWLATCQCCATGKKNLNFVIEYFAEYNQQNANFSQFIYFCKTLYMFQMGFSVHHKGLKTAHTALGICVTN